MEPIDDDIYVLKRDNEKSLYDISKIGKALDNVFIEDSIKNELLTAIDKKIRTTELKEVNIEFIQDIVENTLRGTIGLYCMKRTHAIHYLDHERQSRHYPHSSC